MEKFSIEVKLSVEKELNKIVAHLVFKNISERKIYLDKQTIYYNGVVRNNYFEIMDSHHEEVDYLGKMINCSLLPENFIELAGGDIIKSTVPLSDFYKMVQGNKYEIQYYAYNPTFQEEAHVIEMQSNKVEIAY